MSPVRYTHGFETVLAGYAAVDLSTIASRDDADAQMRPLIAGSGLRAFLLQNLVRDGGEWRWRLNMDALAAAQKTITGFPGYPPGTRYTGPAAFIHGELSDYVKPSHYPAIRTLFPKASLQVVEGAGHWVYADQPAAFLDRLDAFFDRID
jgi:pimeloyl-ACP methyl ester carboxylesterase